MVRTEMAYDIIAVGRTEAEAKAKARAMYRKRTKDNGYAPVWACGTDEPVQTDEEIDEWLRVIGPVPFPGAITE